MYLLKRRPVASESAEAEAESGETVAPRLCQRREQVLCFGGSGVGVSGNQEIVPSP